MGREHRFTRLVAARIHAATILLLAASLPGCEKGTQPEPVVVSVQITSVERGAIQRVIRAEAVLFPMDQAAITPKIASPVAEFYVTRGSRVRKGQLLAVLDNRDLSAATVESQGQLEQAQAAFAAATAANLPEEIQKAKLDVKAAKESLQAEQRLYDSRRNLYQQGAIPRRELDQATVALTQSRNQYQIVEQHLAVLQSVGEKQQVKAAQGQLTSAEGGYEAAKAQLAYSEIRSPIDGVVTARPFYAGEMPTADTPLLTIMNTSKVIARIHIPQQEAALLRPGDGATVSAPGVGDIPATVTLVSPALDPNSTTVEAWVQAPNPGGRLRPGTTVHVSIVAQTRPDAIVIPVVSLLTATDNTTSVMVVGRDGRVHRQIVEVGIREDSKVQITKGLSPGEQIVTAGAYGLPDGTRIQVENSSSTTHDK